MTLPAEEPSEVDWERVLKTLDVALGVTFGLWIAWQVFVPEGFKIDLRCRSARLVEYFTHRQARRVATEMWADVIDLQELGVPPRLRRQYAPALGLEA